MSHLRRYLERHGILDAEKLNAALRRQQIYGGSLDTVLLELDFIGPAAVDGLLGNACDLPVVPLQLLESGNDRPWNAIPSKFLQIGWAAPLSHSGRDVLVAIHPDLPLDRRHALLRQVPNLLPMVTAECCIEKIAAERRMGVVPQRYAVLCATYISALRRARPLAPVEPPVAPRSSEPDEDTVSSNGFGLAVPLDEPDPPLAFEASALVDPEPSSELGLQPFGPDLRALEPSPEPLFSSADFHPSLPLLPHPVATDLGSSNHASNLASNLELDLGSSNHLSRGSLDGPPSFEASTPFVVAFPHREASTLTGETEAPALQSPTHASAAFVSEDVVRRHPSANVPTLPGFALLDTKSRTNGEVRPTSMLRRGEQDVLHDEPEPHGIGSFAPFAIEPEFAADVPPTLEVTPPLPPDPEPVVLFHDPHLQVIPSDGPTSIAEPTEDAPPPVRFSARGTPLAPSSRHMSRIDDPATQRTMARARKELATAPNREAAINALVRAATTVTSRIAVFRVRDDSLLGLSTSPPSTLPNMQGVILDASADAPMWGPLQMRRWAGETTDPRLKAALHYDRPIPCLICRVDLADRPLLLLYSDHGGREFLPAEANTLEELCSEASLTFESILKARTGVVRMLEPGSANRPETRHASVDPPPEFGTADTTPIEVPIARAAHVIPRNEPAANAEPYDRGPVLTVTGAPEPPTNAGPVARDTHSPSSAAVAPALDLVGLASSRPRLAHDAVPAIGPRFVPPLIDAEGNSGVIDLASPFGVPTARGKIYLDEEDWAADNTPLPIGNETPHRRIDAVLQSIASGEANIDALRSLGEAGLQRLAVRFPGPLEVLRRDLRALPPPSAHGPHIRTAIALGSPFVPHLIGLLVHAEPDVRFYAAFVFQELRDPACMDPLSDLAFDNSTDVRVIAMRVLETYSRSDEFSRAVGRVRAELDSGDRNHQLHATRAVGTLRDIDAIPRLVDLLTNPDRFIQEAALESLCSITGQQHGLKPHRWRSWHADNRERHRIEWIVDSLRHRDLPVRRWAHDELIRVTGHRVPFSPLGDRQSREVAARAWTDWWTTSGRFRFEGGRTEPA